MRAFPRFLTSTALTVAFASIAGCRGDLTWRILFREAADRDATRTVQARIHEGGCDGAVVFETEIARDNPGMPARPLPDGTYGVEALAVDANCQVIARTCALLTMPTTTGLVLTLEHQAPVALCAPAMCQAGVCGEGRDAGLDARDGAMRDAPSGDAPFVSIPDAGVDADMMAGMDAPSLDAFEVGVSLPDAGPDAPPDAFVLPDAFVPPDAFTPPDAFMPAAPQVLAPWNGVTTGTFRALGTSLSDAPMRPSVTWSLSSGAASYALEMVACNERDLALCDFTAAVARVVVDAATTTARPPADLDITTTAPGGRRYAFRVGACTSPSGGACRYSAPRYLDVGRHTQDLNGDGFDEMVVTRTSTVEAHDGTGNTPSTTVILASGPTLSNVAYAGDYDADGAGEVVLNAGTPTGRWELRHGDGTLMGSDVGGAATDQLAQVLASAGDVDGDGYADFLVAAPGLREVRVQYGGATFDAARRTVITSDPSLMNFALDMTNAGDRDADGFADIAIASRVSVGMARVEVFSLAGRVARRIQTIDVATGETSIGVVPIQIAGGYDIDGDARPDLAFGLGFLNQLSFAFGDGTSGVEMGTGTFGRTMSMGDLAGSGFGRAIFGAPTYTAVGVGGGAYGHTTFFGGPVSTYIRIINNEGWGQMVGCADLDGDGRDDLFSFGRTGGVGHIGTFSGGEVGGTPSFRFLFGNPVRFLAR